MINKKIKFKECLVHKTKKSVLKRFLIILTIVAIYFAFSIGRYGFSSGILVTFLTWSLFVLGTPIADAGFLLDFPIRFFTKIRMIYSEAFVWFIAISLNFFTILFFPEVYNKTSLLIIFKNVLVHPFPYWIIIILSAAGTFFSIYFGDELLDIVHFHQRKKLQKHKNKHLLILILFFIALIILSYYYLLTKLGVNL